jgi:hypothetical protein
MSFLDKFKNKGRDGRRSDDDDIGSMFDEVVALAPDDMALAGAAAGGGVRSSAVRVERPHNDTQSPTTVTSETASSSIMSEATASELRWSATCRWGSSSAPSAAC